jgi:hypothetical protein
VHLLSRWHPNDLHEGKAGGTMTSTQAAILRQLGRRPMLPALLLRRRPERPRAGVVVFGLALFVAVFAVRLVVPSTSDPMLIFSCRADRTAKDGRAARVRATVEGLASDTGVLLVRLRRAHVWPEIVGP